MHARVQWIPEIYESVAGHFFSLEWVDRSGLGPGGVHRVAMPHGPGQLPHLGMYQANILADASGTGGSVACACKCDVWGDR